MKLLCFHVAGQGFGVPIATVKETLPERPLTRLFLVPPFVAGLVNLRGEVVAVLDLAALLDLPRHADGGRRRAPSNIVILRASLLPQVRDPRHAANRPGAGFYVDGLDGVRDVAEADVKPPPATLAPEPASYLDGIAAAPRDDGAPRPLLLLNPARVLASPELNPYRRELR